VADVNLDGSPDLIAGASSGSVLILLGNGNGTFRAGPTYMLNGAPQAIAVGDFNRDGKPDLVQVYGSSADVLLGNGDGTFQSGIVTNSLQPRSGSNLVVGDFDGDGRMDIAYRAYFFSAVAMAPGNGDGTFQSPIMILTDGMGTTGPQADLALADFNGDGVPDIATANINGGTVDVFLGGQLAGLSIEMAHTGSLMPGQTKVYTITVTNSTFVTTSGPVIVTDMLPVGFSATAISGIGWNCTLSTLTCTNSNMLASSSSFQPISLTILAASNLMPSTLTNTASVTSSGITNTIGDPTLIVSPTAISLSVSPNPVALGQAVTMTATVSSGATGTVLFIDGPNPIGVASLSGNQATFTTRLLGTGLRTMSRNLFR
jgi:uncharacterized repeat protein (TIGR01451 family)